MPDLPPPAPSAGGLRLGGLTPLSLTDYPGLLSAVVFCQGCSWSCVYCQNAHLRPADTPPALSWEAVLDFLRRRVGLLDAVVFSGGEPTLQSGLAEAMDEVVGLGFQVGLHTAGPSPERLAQVLPLADWVGFDVKAPFGAYERITGVPGSGDAAKESLRRLIASGTDHECRTTCHPSLTNPAELAELTKELYAMGARSHVFQAFRAEGCGDASLAAQAGAPVEKLLDDASVLSWRAERRG